MALETPLEKVVNEKELKEKYGKVFKLDIPTDNGEKTLYLRRIDRLTYKAFMSMVDKDELLAGEMVLRALTVEGDAEEIIKDFDALRIAGTLLIEVVGTKTGNVVAL